MKWDVFDRVISIAGGAAVLFILRQGFGQALYVAIGGGIFVYVALRALFAYLARAQAGRQ
ncbi:MAG: hypothetical protein JO237_07890 [Pseudolabrys sp.]|nr:hypothetical protein [Pseudolabrys sp.]